VFIGSAILRGEASASQIFFGTSYMRNTVLKR